MRVLSLEPTSPRRLVHYTPLRYPGGKAKLAAYVKALIQCNRLCDGDYVEPYAGGAAIALELLFHDYVANVHINDVSRPVYAFWTSVLHKTESLCRLVRDTPLTLESWDKQKKVFANPDGADDLALGFATFFLNRTNRSGILNGGMIGGREQLGEWKIDARFNREELIFRIVSIAKFASQIHLTKLDALKFLSQGLTKWPEKTLIYLDPPYYVKGRDLYYDFYQDDDHADVARFVRTRLANRKWIVSYDRAPQILALYEGEQTISYRLGYSARQSSKEGSEAMFFGKSMRTCPLVGPIRLLEETPASRVRLSA